MLVLLAVTEQGTEGDTIRLFREGRNGHVACHVAYIASFVGKRCLIQLPKVDVHELAPAPQNP
jgi:hypothetical protein